MIVRGATTTLLTALLALPSLQHFRCRRSRVGLVVTFSMLCLNIILHYLIAIAVIGGLQGPPAVTLYSDSLQSLILAICPVCRYA